MNSQVPKYVTQGRAALLLGISEDELSRLSQESGLGHTECAGEQEETFFTTWCVILVVQGVTQQECR